MAKRDKLRDAAVRIGSTVGRMDGAAHKAARKAVNAIDVAKDELNQMAKQVDALKKQLAKSSRRLQDAIK